MKWVYNPRKLLAKLSAVPTLSLLAPMPWAVLCGMQWVGKLAHFTRTLSAIANHLHVCSQKGICAAAAATGSQGKLQVAHCSHCAKVQTAAWLSSDVMSGSAVTSSSAVMCRGTFCNAVPCGGWFEKCLFTGGAQMYPQLSHTRAHRVRQQQAGRRAVLQWNQEVSGW